MAETAQQYTARITGFIGDRDPLEILADTPVRLLSLVSNAKPSELVWTTSPDRWSVAQIAAHLADAEIVGAWRIRSVLEKDGVALQAYDQNTWAAHFRYEAVPAEESAAVFGALRASNLHLLRRVDAALHTHVGMHAERGPESIPHIVRMYAGHDLNHLGQIERLLDEARRAQA